MGAMDFHPHPSLGLGSVWGSLRLPGPCLLPSWVQNLVSEADTGFTGIWTSFSTSSPSPN